MQLRTHPKAYAACATLRALADFDESENLLLQREARSVGVAASAGGSQMEVGETLTEHVVLFFQGALAALRHALSAGALDGAAELAEFNNIEGQLNSLLSTAILAPVFYWHGPRRHAIARLKLLLQNENVHRILKSTAGDCNSFALMKGDVASVVGDTTPAANMADPESLTHGVPRVGVAVGGPDGCDMGETCDIQTILYEAGIFNGKGKVHVKVLPSAKTTLQKIGKALEGLKDPWISMLLPNTAVAGDRVTVTGTLKSALKSLGLKRLDLLWLPYAAFPKPVWAKVKPQLEEALEKGLIGAYGASLEIGDGKTAKGLFQGREPAPKAWLSHHDLLQQANADAVEVARKLGMAVLAMPRTSALERSVVPTYLETVGGKDAEFLPVHHSWVLQRAFGLVLEVPSGEHAKLLQGAVPKMGKLSKASLQLLDDAAQFSRHRNASAETRSKNSDGTGLLQNLKQWQHKAAEPPSTPAVQSVDILASSSGHFVPGITKSHLDNIPKQSKQFKANHRILYTKNFFDEATFAAIQAEAKRLWKSEDIEANCNLNGNDRLGGYVLDHTSKNSSLYQLIYGNEDFRRWVSGINDEGPMFPSDFPIEIREYPEGSAGMACHPDLQMYAVPKKDLEFAFTVDNFSKCLVSFYEKDGTKHEVWSEPNSMFIVGVNSATHCVSATEGGHRTILKWIYVGDFRKAKAFDSYKGNTCASNPNGKMLKTRRETKGAYKGRKEL